MLLSSTVMKIWPFEVLPEKEVGRRSVVNMTLISYTPLRYVRNVACEKLKMFTRDTFWDSLGELTAPQRDLTGFFCWEGKVGKKRKKTGRNCRCNFVRGCFLALRGMDAPDTGCTYSSAVNCNRRLGLMSFTSKWQNIITNYCTYLNCSQSYANHWYFVLCNSPHSTAYEWAIIKFHTTDITASELYLKPDQQSKYPKFNVCSKNEGRLMNKLQNRVILLVFQILKIRNIRFVGN